MDTTKPVKSEDFTDVPEADIEAMRRNVATYLEWNKDGSQAVVQNMRIRENGDRD
ncbi:MAG TPA: hypothetical protein VN181_03185 [Thermoanaerobaculia bacterium]|nr:hypothetical protein [Thermoanaerobaculia bacterium]